MNLVGNQRGHVGELAVHLMKPEYEKAVVHQIRGFMCNDLRSSLQESAAVARTTKCSEHLYSLSLNPPHEAEVSAREFEAVADRAKERLGLFGQPRLPVIHEKIGQDGQLRRHAHAVWCRIDVESMTAIHIPFDHTKLQASGKELFLEHGWELPAGYLNKQERDPLNFTLEEWQQAKRRKKDPKVIKQAFQEAWASSDGKASFVAALKDHDYILACGDRRGFVAVDNQGEVYAVARYVGVRTKEAGARLGDLDDLPSVEQA